MRRIAVLSYNHNKYSETFIQNQVKYLPAEVHLLYGGELPVYYGNGQTFLENGAWDKVSRTIKKAAGVDATAQHQQKVEEYLVSNKIEAVLANYSVTAFPVMEICHRLDIPLIVHFHGWTAYRSTILEKYNNEYKRLFEIARAFIAVSNDMVEQLKRLGAPAGKIHKSIYGFNPDYFQYSDHSTNQNIFFAAGRFCDTKNPHLTIMAFNKVLEKVPDARLVMAGGDETLLNACVNLVKTLRIEVQVSFAGVLSPQEIFAQMQKSIAFVQHSATTILGEKEGAPVTIIEAQANGLPVVATRHAGIPEIVEDGISGLLVEEFDVNGMAEKMIQLARERSLVQSMGKAATERANKFFTMERYIATLMTVLESCIVKKQTA